MLDQDFGIVNAGSHILRDKTSLMLRIGKVEEKAKGGIQGPSVVNSRSARIIGWQLSERSSKSSTGNLWGLAKLPY